LGETVTNLGAFWTVSGGIFAHFGIFFDRFMADFDRLFRARFFVSHWDNLG
jgi:hypothetical protein